MSYQDLQNKLDVSIPTGYQDLDLEGAQHGEKKKKKKKKKRKNEDKWSYHWKKKKYI